MGGKGPERAGGQEGRGFAAAALCTVRESVTGDCCALCSRGWQRLLDRRLGHVTASRVRLGAREMPGQKEQSAVWTGSLRGTPTQENLTRDPGPAPRSSAPAHQIWARAQSAKASTVPLLPCQDAVPAPRWEQHPGLSKLPQGATALSSL